MRETFERNFFGAFVALREFIPLLRKGERARVVNVSSDMGSISNINNPEMGGCAVMSPAYQSAKAALNALTVLFAKELAKDGIKVNSASPGWCQTDMGTADAPLTVEQGARTAVWLATLPDDGPTAGFFSATRDSGAIGFRPGAARAASRAPSHVPRAARPRCMNRGTGDTANDYGIQCGARLRQLAVLPGMRVSQPAHARTAIDAF